MNIQFRQAFVRVTREKSVFVLLVTALGLALGAVVCALSFAHLLVLQPLPYPEQARLVIAEQHIFDQGNSAHSQVFSYPAVKLLHENAGDVFSASVMIDRARDVVVSHPAQPLVGINYIQGDYAALLIAVNLGLLREGAGILNAPKIDLDRSASAFLYQSPSAAKQTVSPENPFGEVKRRLLELPGVEAVSQSHSPLQDFIQTAVAANASGAQFQVELKRIDHEYLNVTGQHLAVGRNFEAADIDAASNGVLINPALANLLERNGAVLGVSLQRKGETPFVVLGVVNELAYPQDDSDALASAARIYLPASRAGSNFIIKFKPGFRLSRTQLVALVVGVNAGFGVFLYDDLQQQRLDMQLPRRIAIAAASAIAMIVIIVSGIGLYGMLSYTTYLRRSEIGARRAFGAKAQHIVFMLMRNNAKVLIIGCAASATFSWLLTSLWPWLNAHWRDASIAFGLLGLLVVGACYLSARPLLARSPAAILRSIG
jgi:hypothetical protein